MVYENITMIPKEHTQERYALIKYGTNPLIVIGFNPSTADESQPDPTMRSVLRIASTNGYDGIIMLNLYPMRSTSPDSLPRTIDERLHSTNTGIIKDILLKYANADVLAAFGNLVFKRDYTLQCAREILALTKETHHKILCIDTLCSGMPRHPLYAKASSILKPYSYAF